LSLHKKINNIVIPLSMPYICSKSMISYVIFIKVLENER